MYFLSLSLQEPYESGTIIILVLHRRKLRHSEQIPQEQVVICGRVDILTRAICTTLNPLQDTASSSLKK